MKNLLVSWSFQIKRKFIKQSRKPTKAISKPKEGKGPPGGGGWRRQHYSGAFWNVKTQIWLIQKRQGKGKVNTVMKTKKS